MEIKGKAAKMELHRNRHVTEQAGLFLSQTMKARHVLLKSIGIQREQNEGGVKYIFPESNDWLSPPTPSIETFLETSE